MLYYVFDNKEDADAAENYISQIGGAPIVGINAGTGHLSTNARTMRWAIPWQRQTDGKWIFPYVGDDLINKFPSEQTEYFNRTFNYTLEEYQENWNGEDDD